MSISTHVVQQQGPFQVEGEGAGTGIVIDEAGHILTNAHVVEGATEVSVAVNGEERSATVVGGDSSRDVAVLQLDDPSGVVPADLGSSADVAVGDQVVAIGNALALEGGPTVTQGIVSAIDRSIDTPSSRLTNLIQTDADDQFGQLGRAVGERGGPGDRRQHRRGVERRGGPGLQHRLRDPDRGGDGARPAVHLSSVDRRADGREYRRVMAHDLVIRGGTVVDGTGAPARTADVAVDGGLIAAVGDGSGRPRHA